MIPESANTIPTAPLRVGVLIESFTQPGWVYKVLSDIESSSIATISLVIVNPSSTNASQGVFRRTFNSTGHLLYKLYTKLDQRLFKSDPGAFAATNVEDLLSGVLVVEPLNGVGRGSDNLREADLEAIREQNLDVVLDLESVCFPAPSQGMNLKIAKYGIWSYYHRDPSAHRRGPPGFWEVMGGEPVTGAALLASTDGSEPWTVIYSSYASTDKRSVIRNKNNYYWKTSTFVMMKLRDLYELGEPGLSGDAISSFDVAAGRRTSSTPTDFEMVRCLSKISLRYGMDKLAQLMSFDQWFLAYKIHGDTNGPDTSLQDFKVLLPPKDRFWADPFPVKRGDKHFLFFEEAMLDTNRGHISVMEIDENGSCSEPVKVLEREYHLSYPFLFEWKDDLYMVPETSENRTIESYRCVSFPYEWRQEAVFLENVRAADTTIAEINGVWWMFTSIAVDGASPNDELHLFYSDGPLGPWHPHRRNPVKSDVRSSRPAGHLFERDGSLFRPAQDCSERYGYAISMNRVVRIDPDEFCEEEDFKILPAWRRGNLATHTINSCDGITVVDGLMKRSRFLGRA